MLKDSVSRLRAGMEADSLKPKRQLQVTCNGRVRVNFVGREEHPDLSSTSTVNRHRGLMKDDWWKLSKSELLAANRIVEPEIYETFEPIQGLVTLDMPTQYADVIVASFATAFHCVMQKRGLIVSVPDVLFR
jgi:hypothetical protein